MQTMQGIYKILELINIFFLLACITVVIKRKEERKYIEPITLIPFFSLSQTIASNFRTFLKQENGSREMFMFLSVDIYTYIELVLIIVFFLNKWNKRAIAILSIILIIFSLFYRVNAHFITPNSRANTIGYLTLIEGFWIEFLAINSFINHLSKKGIERIDKDPRMIISLGIFLSFLLIWPFNVLQYFFLNYFGKELFVIFFISNSIGYNLLLLSILISLYVTKRAASL